MSERQIGVLIDAAKRRLVRVRLVRPAGAMWICDSYGTVNHTATSLYNAKYIYLTTDVCWYAADRFDPRLRNRLRHIDGRVEVYGLTAHGWAGVRRQYSSEQTNAWLGPVPGTVTA